MADKAVKKIPDKHSLTAGSMDTRTWNRYMISQWVIRLLKTVSTNAYPKRDTTKLKLVQRAAMASRLTDLIYTAFQSKLPSDYTINPAKGSFKMLHISVFKSLLDEWGSQILILDALFYNNPAFNRIIVTVFMRHIMGYIQDKPGCCYQSICCHKEKEEPPIAAVERGSEDYSYTYSTEEASSHVSGEASTD